MARARPALTLEQLSSLNCEAFTAHLAGVFEHSPWVAERAWSARPFPDLHALHAALLQEMVRAGGWDKLCLVRAHPDLAGREARAGTLTAESTDEQKSAGLDACTPEELARIGELNAAYRRRFGFPFIIAVRGRTRHAIMNAMAERLGNDWESEFRNALREIGRIARLRLEGMFPVGTDRAR